MLISEELCVGCGKCVELCPKEILCLDSTDGKCRVTDENQCDKLAGCQGICPTKAIVINR